MGDKSAIHWTDATWNPLVGCSRVSEGCRNCYAEREAATRLAQTPKYHGLASEVNGHPSWTGEVRLWEPHLDQPLRWRAPRRIFVNSMSDLFHEKVPWETINAIFGVMQQAYWHIFQVLTKRPERMLEWSQRIEPGEFLGCLRALKPEIRPARIKIPRHTVVQWPLPNVWLGVSVEDQATADERIVHLLKTPAAVRWVSYEPALGPVDFKRWLDVVPKGMPKVFPLAHTAGVSTPLLDWLVVGGESGPGARLFDLVWARSTIAQCRAAGVPVFCKQLGAIPWGVHADVVGQHVCCGAKTDAHRLFLRDRKGGDMAEWPEDLRVREYPK